MSRSPTQLHGITRAMAVQSNDIGFTNIKLDIWGVCNCPSKKEYTYFLKKKSHMPTRMHVFLLVLSHQLLFYSNFSVKLDC